MNQGLPPHQVASHELLPLGRLSWGMGPGRKREHLEKAEQLGWEPGSRACPRRQWVLRALQEGGKGFQARISLGFPTWSQKNWTRPWDLWGRAAGLALGSARFNPSPISFCPQLPISQPVSSLRPGPLPIPLVPKPKV